MASQETVRIVNDQQQAIVGILQKKENTPNDNRIVLILHGVLGHKNYLFHRLLAEKLPYASFRFDFRGNGDSEGQAGYANMSEDVEDVHTVANYFITRGYTIYAVIGHSRGSVAGLKYATTCPRPVPHVVNIAGRFKMNDNQVYKNRPEIGEALDRQGYFDWNVRQRDKIVSIKVTTKDVERFCQWDNSHVSNMPLSTCVLICHGIDDKIVPPYNAAMYANMIPNHRLALLPGCDHNFKGKFEELVSTIVDHFAMHESNSFAQQLAMGQHTGLHIPRWIDVPGTGGVADIGGWLVRDNTGYIRERTVFRAVNLHDISSGGKILLRDSLSVDLILDFTPPLSPNDISLSSETIGMSCFSVRLDNYDHDNMALTLNAIGPSIVSALVQLGDSISLESRQSVVIHSTKADNVVDIFIALLLGLCTVDKSIIMQERHGACSKTLHDGDVVIKAWDHIHTNEGSIFSYLQYHGYTQDQYDKLRQALVVPIHFEERQLYRGDPSR